MFSVDQKYKARKRRARSLKRYGFQKRSAGRVSGMLGALSGVRRGCTCCDYYGANERRMFKRQERALWLKDWQDEQESELREMMAFGSFE